MVEYLIERKIKRRQQQDEAKAENGFWKVSCPPGRPLHWAEESLIRLNIEMLVFLLSVKAILLEIMSRSETEILIEEIKRLILTPLSPWDSLVASVNITSSV